MRPRNDVDADQFPHPAGGGRTGVGCRLDGAHIATHGDANQPCAHEFLALQDHVRRLHHGIGGFDCGDQTFRFNQAKGLHHFCLQFE